MHKTAIVMAALTISLGGFAGWAANATQAAEDTGATRNKALIDNARTSDVKGQVAGAIGTVFSYNYTDTAKTERAAQQLLTGKAISQYNQLFARVRQQAPQQKQVLTTTVTDSGVISLSGDRARLLIFADQRNTATGTGKTAASGAVFAVEAVYSNERWKISSIDTFS